MKKQERQYLLQQLKEQDVHQKAYYDRLLLDKLKQEKSYQSAESIAIYLPFNFEYNTNLVINTAQKDNKKLLIPKTYPQGRLIFTAYDLENLEKNKFGIWESMSSQEISKEDIDLILVPGLGFRSDGYRLGFGRGYYDRYLSDYNGETISLAYPFQLIDFLIYPHDVPVRKVLLP